MCTTTPKEEEGRVGRMNVESEGLREPDGGGRGACDCWLEAVDTSHLMPAHKTREIFGQRPYDFSAHGIKSPVQDRMELEM